MIRIADNKENFIVACKEGKQTVVLYGAGRRARQFYPFLPKIDYVCDKNAEAMGVFGDDKQVMLPKELEDIEGKLIILVCLKNRSVFSEVVNELKQLKIDADIYDLFDNIAFDVYKPVKYIEEKKKLERVRIVCDNDGWILTKFAQKMEIELNNMGIAADIAQCPDLEADINHYIAFHLYEPLGNCNDTLMITHVDSLNKVERLKHQLNKAKMGICMSKETMNWLMQMGISRERLCYINPAQDTVIRPKKIVLGITHRCYDATDNRKSSSALLSICSMLNPDYFIIKIMGSGWDCIVAKLQGQGFEVVYYPDFDYELYTKDLIPSLDYYLYWGFDEGSMGFLDAVAAGVGTIVTPQGYHLDVCEGITYACNTIDEFSGVLLDIQRERERRCNSVRSWTWEQYTKKHVEVWNYLLGNTENLLENKHTYLDGIYSVLTVDA